MSSIAHAEEELRKARLRLAEIEARHAAIVRRLDAKWKRIEELGLKPLDPTLPHTRAEFEAAFAASYYAQQEARKRGGRKNTGEGQARRV